MVLTSTRANLLVRRARSVANRPLEFLDDLGDQLSFYLRALAWTPCALRRYSREIVRLRAEVSFGSGALAVIGGTVGVIAALSLFTGTVVGLQGFAALDQIGSSALTGFISAYFNTREIAPLVAGLALSATVGCGFTAQLGAMRISEEIDALETMAVPSLPYLVTTRIIAGFVAVVPLYVVGLLASYLASRTVTTLFYSQSTGTYDHYFNLFLPPVDVLWSFAKVLLFSIVIIFTHCFYGYRASGRPAAVGVYAGSDVRVLGVKVGTVDSVEPQGDVVKVVLDVDDSVAVPAGAQATEVSPSVVADRYVQLLPAYTGGDRMASGGVIPRDRTATPVELDKLYSSLDDISTALGPDGANADGAVSQLLDTTAANQDGNGAALGNTLTEHPEPCRPWPTPGATSSAR